MTTEPSSTAGQSWLVNRFIFLPRQLPQPGPPSPSH